MPAEVDGPEDAPRCGGARNPERSRAAPTSVRLSDATEWVLADRTRVTNFRFIDDHSRLALASLVAPGETSAAAIAVVTLAIERYGAPQKFLSDNGAAGRLRHRAGHPFTMGKEHIGQAAHIICDEATIMFFGPQGTEIISHSRPPEARPTSATASSQASPPTSPERAENEPATRTEPAPDKYPYRKCPRTVRHQLSTKS